MFKLLFVRISFGLLGFSVSDFWYSNYVCFFVSMTVFSLISKWFLILHMRILSSIRLHSPCIGWWKPYIWLLEVRFWNVQRKIYWIFIKSLRSAVEVEADSGIGNVLDVLLLNAISDGWICKYPVNHF